MSSSQQSRPTTTNPTRESMVYEISSGFFLSIYRLVSSCKGALSSRGGGGGGLLKASKANLSSYTFFFALVGEIL